MNDSTLSVLLTMRDEASPQLQAFGATVAATGTPVAAFGGKLTGAKLESTGFSDSLVKNKAAIRELAMGVTYLGVSFLGMGVALQRSHSLFLQNIGSNLSMVGGIMMAVGASVHFISAIAKMVHALRELNIAQILTKALQGPAGWAALGVGLAVAGTVTGLTMYSRSQKESGGNTYVSNTTVHGSVVTERQLVNQVQRGLVIKRQQNALSPIQ